MISLHPAGARASRLFPSPQHQSFSTSLALHSWRRTPVTQSERGRPAGGRVATRMDSPHMWRTGHMAGDRRVSGRRGDGGRQRCESAGARSTCSAMTCASDEASSALDPSADRPAGAQHPLKVAYSKTFFHLMQTADLFIKPSA